MHDDDPPVEALADAIRHTHGCASTFVERVDVTETLGEAIVWSGTVAIFDLQGHAGGATRAYAWSYPTEGRRRRFVAIVGLGPVTSAQTAVQAYLIAEAKRRGVA